MKRGDRFRGHTWFRIIALAVFLCTLSSCNGPNRRIVGKWRTSGDAANAMVWEFSENGSFGMGDIRGRYRFGDSNRIKIETPFATSVYQAEISGDRMILREANGSKLEFTRMVENRR
jgi:hypothetical protein